MRAILHSFPPASAGGPTGLRPQHLVDCLGSASTHAQSLLLEALCELCHRGLEGSLAPRTVAYMCAARLIPLKKVDGGVRPIAIGETLRRVIAKFVLRQPASARAQCWMSPLQTAFTRGSPCETVGMGVQELVLQLSGREDWGLLQVDVRNAFNTLQRETILGAVATQAPELTAWVRQTLQPAPLLCGKEVIWSAQGVQQGDPMGPFLFSLGIHDVLNLLPKDMLLHRWYLDDGVLMGTLPQLHHAIELLEAHFPRRGLLVNYTKTTLWGPAATPTHIAMSPNGSRLRSTSLRPIGDVMRVLGVPVAASGNELAMQAYLDNQASRITADMNRVARVPDKQVAHSVLRNCLGPVQAQFLLRTVDHSVGKEFAAKIELAQRSAWERLLGTQLTPKAWMQSTLPNSKGGCGLQVASQVALAGRTASILSFIRNAELMLGQDASVCRRLMGEGNLVESLVRATSPEFEPVKYWSHSRRIDASNEDGLKQAWWTAKLTDFRSQTLLRLCATRDVARVSVQASGGGAGSWMLAPPNMGDGSRMNPTEYGLLLRWHLGLPVMPTQWAGAGCPKCGSACDAHGDHAVSCQKGLVTLRHHGVVNYICQVLQTAKIPFERESACLGDGRRPADILLKGWEGRRDLAVDVTVVHPLAPSGDMSVDGAKKALRQAADSKDRYYKADCEQAGIGFSPLCLTPGEVAIPQDLPCGRLWSRERWQGW